MAFKILGVDHIGVAVNSFCTSQRICDNTEFDYLVITIFINNVIL